MYPSGCIGCNLLQEKTEVQEVYTVSYNQHLASYLAVQAFLPLTGRKGGSVFLTVAKQSGLLRMRQTNILIMENSDWQPY